LDLEGAAYTAKAVTVEAQTVQFVQGLHGGKTFENDVRVLV
jgi:hypothetical protein